MLLNVMRECRNFFDVSSEKREFSIANSILELKDVYHIGQYILVTGSMQNDGIYLLKDRLYTLEGGEDECFSGTVYGLKVPRDFVDLCDEIALYCTNNPMTNILTERFGDYSYTRSAEQESGVIVGVTSWEKMFRRRLQKYAKMFCDIKI